MACVTCTEASDAPQHHAIFADYCLHCAARRIQYIQRSLNLAPDAIRTRCRTALAQAMALGLPEQEIRAMAKKTEWQLQQPATDAQPASLPAPRKRGG
jgi:hypothetical protein